MKYETRNKSTSENTMNRQLTFMLMTIMSTLILMQCGLPIEPIRDIPYELSVKDREIAASGNTFGLQLFRELNKEEIGNNMFISPLSVSYALGMTLNGAVGETRTAMMNTLALKGLSTAEINASYKNLMTYLMKIDPKVILEIANSIWYADYLKVEQEFIDVNKKYFDALVRALNFGDPVSVDIINGWISEKTHGKIEEVIEEIRRDDVMFLINAIYFKGSWLYEFEPNETKDATFTLEDGRTVPVKMMEQKSDFRYFNNADFQAIDLPYGDEKYSMTIFLPRHGKKVDDLIAEMTEENWKGWVSELSGEKQPVNLFMPRFTLEYDVKLKDVLISLGMGVAFSGAADFSNIDKAGGLWIDDVLHNTFVEVNEEGTEAAAVTVVIIVRDSGGPPIMRIDRPFIFVIREHESDTILFMGKIVEPEST
jgi:serine protease inhibitor